MTPNDETIAALLAEIAKRTGSPHLVLLGYGGLYYPPPVTHALRKCAWDHRVLPYDSQGRVVGVAEPSGYGSSAASALTSRTTSG